MRGSSDTEVLLEGMVQWGVLETLKRANGMLAFAVYDREAHEIWLARDRMGEKPLYYGTVGNNLVFASELKSFWTLPSFSPNINNQALDAFLQLGYVPQPMSIYEGISKLEAGGYIRMQLGGSSPAPQIGIFYALSEVAQEASRNPLKLDDAAAIQEIGRLLDESVKIRTFSDVPLGAFLSGGIDSSLIVATMQRQVSKPVKTFSIGFSDPLYDESKYAAAVAKHLGTDHTEWVVEPHHVFDVVPKLAHMYDGPFADSSQIPTQLVSKLARKEVTVSLWGTRGQV